MMRVLQRILFAFAIVIGLSVAVSAQKEDPKKPPPKPPPPVINPGEGKKPKDPKKPGMAFVIGKLGSDES